MLYQSTYTASDLLKIFARIIKCKDQVWSSALLQLQSVALTGKAGWLRLPRSNGSL